MISIVEANKNLCFLRLLVNRIIIHPIYLRASLRSRPRYRAYVYRKNKTLRNIWKESARPTFWNTICFWHSPSQRRFHFVFFSCENSHNKSEIRKKTQWKSYSKLNYDRLAKPATLNQYVQRVALPTNCVPTGTMCRTSEWGNTLSYCQLLTVIGMTQAGLWY